MALTENKDPPENGKGAGAVTMEEKNPGKEFMDAKVVTENKDDIKKQKEMNEKCINNLDQTGKHNFMSKDSQSAFTDVDSGCAKSEVSSNSENDSKSNDQKDVDDELELKDVEAGEMPAEEEEMLEDMPVDWSIVACSVIFGLALATVLLYFSIRNLVRAQQMAGSFQEKWPDGQDKGKGGTPGSTGGMGGLSGGLGGGGIGRNKRHLDDSLWPEAIDTDDYEEWLETLGISDDELGADLYQMIRSRLSSLPLEPQEQYNFGQMIRNLLRKRKKIEETKTQRENVQENQIEETTSTFVETTLDVESDNSEISAEEQNFGNSSYEGMGTNTTFSENLINAQKNGLPEAGNLVMGLRVREEDLVGSEQMAGSWPDGQDKGGGIHGSIVGIGGILPGSLDGLDGLDDTFPPPYSPLRGIDQVMTPTNETSTSFVNISYIHVQVAENVSLSTVVANITKSLPSNINVTPLSYSP